MMKNLKAQDIKKRLEFLLEKAELDSEERQWLLNYLEQADGQEFRKIAFELFQKKSNLSELPKNEETILKKIWKNLNKKVFRG